MRVGGDSVCLVDYSDRSAVPRCFPTVRADEFPQNTLPTSFDFAYETLRIDYFGHTCYLSYTKERLSQEVSRVAKRKKYITETVFAPYLIHSFHPKSPLSPWDERPLI
jgi:hypothetical protein